MPIHIERKVHRVAKQSLERDTLAPERIATAEMQVRCRKCPACLRKRAAKWRRTCLNEIKLAERSWFGTLTFTPEVQLHAVWRAEARLRNGGERFEDLSSEDAFVHRVKSLSPLVTRYLKRLRKEYAGHLRFLLVWEAHKSGLPHAHLVIHQCSEHPLTWKHVSGQWVDGFSRFNLIRDGKPAYYVTKYLSKSMLARVRASIDYGNGLCHSEAVATGFAAEQTDT